MEPILLLITYPNNSRELKRFITAILKQGLAKCINKINYVKSYYIWEDKIKNEQEQILLIKSNTKHKEKLEKFIKKAHPYDCPEMIYLTPQEIEKDYLNRLLQ